MFFYKVEGHMPKLSSFGRGKTIRPKKSLTSLLHAALQLFHYRYKLGFRMLVPFQIFFYEIARSDFGISDFGLNLHTKKTPYAN